MRYHLDTNTCVDFLRGRSEPLRDRLRSQLPREVRIPSMVKAELLFGAARSRDPDGETAKVEAFLDAFVIEPFGGAAARRYAAIRAVLAAQGQVIGPNDLVIAATVLAAEGILVTDNTREFERVPGLALANWRE
ncbi:MAG: PIN domain-containing protein [Propionibacteriaceae bacterium]|jgi:tRNA(fMet)-specific endonuclease VapC|nr:PIN domain-containing protein [Propionibacteriaceae bacterium]